MKTKYIAACRRPTFLLNKLTRAGVLLQGVTHGEGRLSFVVFYRQSPLTDALLEEEGISYKKYGYIGINSLLKAVISRPFLLFSAVICIVAVFVFGNFIYGYRIRGNSFVNTARVEQVLREKGVRGIVWKNKVNVAALQRDIAALDGVSFASVKLVGSRLQVDIKEELPFESPDALLYDPIVSSYPATVTKIVAESGTPVVQAGQVVKAGDPLVAPVYAFTEGEAPAPARAAVWGVVTYQKEVLLPSYTVEEVLTGEVMYARNVFLFKKRIGKTPSVPYENYETTECVLYQAFGVKITQTTYRRRAAVTLYHDFDAEAPRLTQDAVCSLLLSVPPPARERGQVRVVQKKLDNVLYLVVYYSVEQRIDSSFTAR